MRRRRGALVPLERAILAAGLRLCARGVAEFCGHALARELREDADAPRLAALTS